MAWMTRASSTCASSSRQLGSSTADVSATRAPFWHCGTTDEPCPGWVRRVPVRASHTCKRRSCAGTVRHRAPRPTATAAHARYWAQWAPLPPSCAMLSTRSGHRTKPRIMGSRNAHAPTASSRAQPRRRIADHDGASAAPTDGDYAITRPWLVRAAADLLTSVSPVSAKVGADVSREHALADGYRHSCESAVPAHARVRCSACAL